LDHRALRRALGEIVRRHQVLRAAVTVTLAGGTAALAIAATAPLPLPVVDLASLTPPRGLQEAERLCRACARRPFLFAEGVWLRAWRLALGAAESWLVLASHHFALDGWSFGVLASELAALYPAYARGAASPLNEPPLQYADFAHRQRRRLAEGDLDGDLAYWRRQLAGAPRALALPADRPRRRARGLAGASRAFPLPAGLAERLDGCCRGAGVTPFMALLAAFQALLGTYSGQDELVVGTAVSNRAGTELEGLVGPFANSLPLRADLAGDPPFAECLARARETTLAAFAHQELPFERLVLEAGLERSGREQPLFQVVFALHDAPWDRLELPGLALRWRPLGLGTARFDLTLEAVRGRGRTLLLIEYSTELFDAATITRLAGHYANLLAAGVASPWRRLSQLPWLAAGERFQLLREWNDAASDYPRGAALPELFAAQASRSAAAVAVECGGRELTYGALDAWAGAAARRLRVRGVGPEIRVGLCCAGLEAMVVGTLAILAAGGAYVPLDPVSPPNRLAAMLADAGVAVVVAERRLLPRLPAAVPPRLVLVLEDVERPAAGDAATATLAVHPLQLAYVMYTSGSTGRPKGVAVPHRAVVRLVLGSNYLALGPADRVAQVANPAFDAVTFEVWGALLCGARVVEVPPGARLSPPRFAAYLRERRITALFLTSALFNQIADEVPDAFAGVRHLLVGGQAVDPTRVRRVLAAGGPERLLNGYGPTESTTFASWHPVRALPADCLAVPIGRPLANTCLHVLDRAGRPAPIGVRGELAIGGDGLARGYVGSPAETAARFVPDPFADTPGGRLY
ncbi:MAG TPA: AMP-binding protein, partial [Thermoanaerobaculia bacterium]